MSVEALTWAFAQEGVPSGAKFVLVALANRANEDGGDLYPSIRWLKKKTSIPERTIRQHIATLQNLNLLTKSKRYRTDGGQTSDEYKLLMRITPLADTAGGVVIQGSAPRQQPPEPLAVAAGQETKEETKEQRGARGARLPAGWTPSELLVAWAKRERPDLDPKKTAEMFRDHWVGVPGRHGHKLDWEATFRNWVRKEKVGFDRLGSPPTPKVMKCGNCGGALTGGWTSSEKGPACNTCHAGYMNGAWPKAKAQ